MFSSERQENDMAVYDGFFDAVQNEDTGEYDRAYGSGDFTQYFSQVIGSGVCVHSDPDSFKVRLEDGKAVVSPGYLFIQGYWCKNDADYPIDLPGTSNYAIVAHLNLGTRMIELEARSVAQAYPDSLVLAIVSPTSAEDTRHNTDICGVIDTAGELSGKVEWAVNYIDNEIEGKLAAAEADINAQAAKLDRKIAEAQAQVDRISPPPIGSIKFSASQDVGPEWLRCDGSFVNEADYPELVAALGKLTPSGDKFQLLSDGEIGPQITNGVVYGGRLWVYSYSTKKLYGVDVEGSGAIKEITVTSEDSYFKGVHPPTTAQPIALSIVESSVDGKTRLFLTQILVDNGTWDSSYPGKNIWQDFLWAFVGEFDPNGGSIAVSAPFVNITTPTGANYLHRFNCKVCVPYVVSRNVGGAERFSLATSLYEGAEYIVEWGAGDENAAGSGLNYANRGSGTTDLYALGQRVAFSSKSKNESVFVDAVRLSTTSYSSYSTEICSFHQGIFTRGTSVQPPTSGEVLTVPNPLNIVGQNKMLFEVSNSAALVVSLRDTDVPQKVSIGVSLPSAARIFVDGGAYLWGKDIFMVFVGTGIIFSRTLEDGSFGYLDTTSVLGTITQFGYLDYSQDEGTLYLLGQDTANHVKVAKIVLNTLYDYANDGAWLPLIASDGVPAYIKAIEGGNSEPITDPVELSITVLTPDGYFDSYANVIFNREVLIAGKYSRTVSKSGTFSVGFRVKQTGANGTASVKLNGATAVTEYLYGKPIGYENAASFKVSDYISGGITLQGNA